MPSERMTAQIVRGNAPAVDPSAPRTARSWEWVCSALVNKECGECAIDILDTIFLQREQIWSWFYTSSGGVVRKKPQRKLTPANVGQRLSAVARSFDQSPGSFVAVCWFEEQRRLQLLTTADCQSYLESCKGNACVSAFVQPRGGLDPTRYANFEHEFVLNKNGRVQTKLHRLALGNQRILSRENDLNKAVSDKVQIALSFVERTKKCRVVGCTSYFIADDFGCLRLWRTEGCSTIPVVTTVQPINDNASKAYDGPHAISERVLARAKADAERVPNDELIQAILSSPTPASKRQTLPIRPSPSPPFLKSSPTFDSFGNRELLKGRSPEFKSRLRSEEDWEKAMQFLPATSSLSRGRKRTLSAAHLVSSQKKGCSGDYCGLDVAVWSSKRISISTPASVVCSLNQTGCETNSIIRASRSSSVISATKAASNFLTAHPNILMDDIVSRKPMSPQKLQMQGENLQGEQPLGHKIPFKLIAQTRAEKQLVDLFIKRYQKGDDGDYLAEVYYGDCEPLGQTFPGYYYQEVQVCNNCFAFYTLVESVRMKALRRLGRKRSAAMDTVEREHNTGRSRRSWESNKLVEVEDEDDGLEVELVSAAAHLKKRVLDYLQGTLVPSISKNDAAELLSLVNPHPAVAMVTSALEVLLFGYEESVPGEVRRNISHDKLLTRIQQFGLATLSEARAKKAVPYARNPLFRPSQITPISACAGKFCEWVLSILQLFAWANHRTFRRDPKTWELLAYLNPDLTGSKYPRQSFLDAFFQAGERSNVSNEAEMTARSPSVAKKGMGATNARRIIQDQQMKRLSAPVGVVESTPFGGNDAVFTCDDNITKIPYTITGQAVAGSTKCNLIVFNDFFDTMESTKVFFRPILARQVGARALFFNMPGQAGSSYFISDSGEAQTIFNNTWCAHRVHELLQHLQVTEEFITTGLPFHLVGFGNGANIATCFAVLFGEHLAYSCWLQSLVLLNGFAAVDSQLAAILHSTVSVLSCFPTNRPDLPVTFFSKYLFSQDYLAKIDINLALSIYTAVTNPITLDGRIRICQGALHHTDLTLQLPRIRVPLVLVQSIENTLIGPTNADPFLHQRVNIAHSWSHQQQGARLPDVLPIKTKRQLQQTLHNRGGAFVAWLRAGHELRQEAKQYVTELLEVVVCSKDAEVQSVHVGPQKSMQAPGTSAAVEDVNTDHLGKRCMKTSGKTDINPIRSIESITPSPPTKIETTSCGETELYEVSDARVYLDIGKNPLEKSPIFMSSVGLVSGSLADAKTTSLASQAKFLTSPRPLDSVVNWPFISPKTVATNLNSESLAPRKQMHHQTIDAEIEATYARMEAEEKRLRDEAEALRLRQQKASEERMEALKQEQERRRRQWEEEDKAHLSALEAKLREEDEDREKEERRQQRYAFLAADLASTEGAPDSPHQPDYVDLEEFGTNTSANILKDTKFSRELVAPHILGMKLAIHANPDLPSMFDRMEAEEKARERVGLMRTDDFDAVKMKMTQNFSHHVKQHQNSLRDELMRRKEGHAIQIQKHIRRFLAINRVLRIRRDNQEASIRRFAGGEIVRAVRGFIGRRRFVKYKRQRTREMEERSSAVVIQRLFRGFICRNSFRQLLRSKKAVVIQRVYRGHRGRLYCEELREAKMRRRFMDRNATKLQATWRMHVARDRFLTQRVAQLAANEIQRIYRGHLGRLEGARKKAWRNAEPGPERLALGLKMIEGSKSAFERQQSEIDALHRAQESVERQVSTIHAELQDSEKELAILERELQEIDQLEADLRELTHEAELIHSGGFEGVLKTGSNNYISPQPLGNGIPLSSAQDLIELPTYEIGIEDVFEGKSNTKKRQADAYAVEMAIQIKRAEREKKKKDLEAEFTSVFAEVQQKRHLLAEMEEKLSDMESLRMRKDREFARMQRNLMELLEEQKLELENLREQGIELETATATSAAAAAATAIKAKEHEKRSQAMFESTEELMKFQFMSMSLSYFSSLNMLKNLRDINADTTAAAITSTAETAAAAAAAAAAANIPAMKRLQVGSADLMIAASQLKKNELEKKMKEEEETKQSNQVPLPDRVNDWSVDDVGRWLDSLSLPIYKKAFKEGAVDGEFLLELRPEDMSDVLGVSHKLHVRKIIVARNRLLPLSQQEQIQIDAVEHEDQARNARQGPGNSVSSNGDSGSLDVDIVFSQARNGRMKRLMESVDAGFDINVEDEKGNTLLLIACQNVNMKMVEYLVAKRANINHKNAQGNTPLHFAMAYDTEGKLGEYLIAHGADDTIENSFGLTAYDGLQPE